MTILMARDGSRVGVGPGHWSSIVALSPSQVISRLSRPYRRFVCGYQIVHETPVPADAIDLARVHREWASEHSPPETVYAVEPAGLLDPALTLLTIRSQDAILLGMGALRELDDAHAELKAMHVKQAARGWGLGRALLNELLAVARDRRYQRLSLETGTTEAFASARSLYASLGFTRCPAFGSYVSSPNSVCMTLALSSEGSRSQRVRADVLFGERGKAFSCRRVEYWR